MKIMGQGLGRCIIDTQGTSMMAIRIRFIMVIRISIIMGVVFMEIHSRRSQCMRIIIITQTTGMVMVILAMRGN